MPYKNTNLTLKKDLKITNIGNNLPVQIAYILPVATKQQLLPPKL
ncbi:hypothetical protein PPHE_b0507 [Pseudoalteromonas phenolica O-BC30]|nr:hypothetical protein [Pseudoalteromonas phenolica O-BC30]